MIEGAARLSELYGITVQDAEHLLKLADERQVQAALEQVRRRGVVDAAGEARKELAPQPPLHSEASKHSLGCGVAWAKRVDAA